MSAVVHLAFLLNVEILQLSICIELPCSFSTALWRSVESCVTIYLVFDGRFKGFLSIPSVYREGKTGSSPYALGQGGVQGWGPPLAFPSRTAGAQSPAQPLVARLPPSGNRGQPACALCPPG